MSDSSMPSKPKPVIDDRALGEIKGYAKRQWDDYHKPPDQPSLIIMGLMMWMQSKGIEIPFELKEIKNDPYRR